jgi:hypothetical protein
MSGAPGEVAGNLLGQIQLRQRQGVGRGVRVARPMSTGPWEAGPQAEGELLISLMEL